MVIAIPASAQAQFRTSELQRLATAVKLDVTKMHEGYNHVMSKDINLTVHMQNSVIDHIGLLLFNDDLRRIDRSSIFDFLERYFLQMKFPPAVKSADKMICDDDFHFERGSMQTVDGLLSTDNFSYQYDNRRYRACWTRNGNEILSVSFPVEYQLISGENKIEAESHILDDILRTKAVTAQEPADRQRNETYIKKGYSNRLYYIGRNLVSSSRYPAETAANMMLSTQAKGDFRLNIKQLSYGFKKSMANIGLKQWISFCQNNHCRLYFGIERVDNKGNVSAVVLAVNTAENYNHVLTVNIPATVIGAPDGTIDACFYPYIPTQNVKNLFGEYEKSNPKFFVSE